MAAFSNRLSFIFSSKIIVPIWELAYRSVAIDEGNSARDVAASYYEGSSLSQETRKRRKIKTSSLLRATPETIIDCY